MPKAISEFKIGDRLIGEASPCFVIAEIGSNHNNDMALAKRLIDASIAAGADAVKFQSFRAETLYSRYVPRRRLPSGELGPEIFPMMKKCEMSYSWHPELKSYCDARGIPFLSSPFDREAVDSLLEVDVPAFKIASSEIGDPLLLKHVARTGKPVIVSTGKASLEDVRDAVEWIRGEGNEQLALLQCAAVYPAADEAMGIRAMVTLRETFGVPVGLSDHHPENLGVVAAVALGAKIVEKHITLDRGMPGPDHPNSLEPQAFAEMVSWIRRTEIMLGDGVKRMHPSEAEGRRIANRSIHAARDLEPGHVLRAEDLVIKRPSLGISGRQYDQVLGRVVQRPVKADMWLTPEDLGEDLGEERR